MTLTVEYDDETPAAEPPETVRICAKCGRGFTGWGPAVGGIDGLPLIVISGLPAAPVCNGRIRTVNRAVHIENVAKALLQIKLRNQLEGRPL